MQTYPRTQIVLNGTVSTVSAAFDCVMRASSTLRRVTPKQSKLWNIYLGLWWNVSFGRDHL